MTQQSTAGAEIVGFFSFFVSIVFGCFPPEVLTCAECPCVGHFGLGFLVAGNEDKVFLPTSESSDDVLSARQVLLLHKRVVMC